MKKTLKTLSVIALVAMMFVMGGCRKDEVTSIVLSANSKTLSIGENFVLAATVNATKNVNNFPITFRSDNPQIAKVDRYGTVTALKEGETNIRVIAGGKSELCHVVVRRAEIAIKIATVNYWGDLYRNNTHVFDFYGLQDGLTLADNGDIVGNGTFLYLDVTSSNGSNFLPAGGYVGTMDGKPNTFMNGNVDEKTKKIVGSYIAIVRNSEIVETELIKGGSIDISGDNISYNISGDLITELGKQYKILYSGEISQIDFVTPMPENLTRGIVQYWGDVDKQGKSKLFSLRLGDNGTDLEHFTGGNDRLAIEIGVPYSTDGSAIPNGTYQVQNTQSVEPNYLLGGYNSGDDFLGTWYYTADKLKITKGSVTIKKVGLTYSVSYNLEDEYFGYVISGELEGQFIYRNMENKSAPMAVRSSVVKKSERNYLNVKDRFRKTSDR